MSCECQPHCTSCTLDFSPLEAACEACDEDFPYLWQTHCYEMCPDYTDSTSGDYTYDCTDTCEYPYVLLTYIDRTECRTECP
jgi:hypothetical protein